MRRIIKGKSYDTNTAQVVHEWTSGHHVGDFHRTDEVLYVTAAGAYFLHGEGGALSRYSQPVGDLRGPGSDITPVSELEAREWLEQHGADADIIERLFDVEPA